MSPNKKSSQTLNNKASIDMNVANEVLVALVHPFKGTLKQVPYFKVHIPPNTIQGVNAFSMLPMEPSQPLTH